jgi:ssDNA-binding Zn-finger/Zn-ribbon topoisomerase 1
MNVSSVSSVFRWDISSLRNRVEREGEETETVRDPRRTDNTQREYQGERLDKTGNRIRSEKENSISEKYETRLKKRMGLVECETCSKRLYKDGSDDIGVSFKHGNHISPEASYSVVLSHEKEHVAIAKEEAKKEKDATVNSTIRLFTAVCPECGKTYISGGETRTITITRDTSSNPPIKREYPYVTEKEYLQKTGNYIDATF